ncbi:hypothetical protein ABW19_dt0210518 [Dactylella cylindrospora]|nr:hypothetical protein ABW19_dt0210518 [Dactylella cylindrospora]
MELHTLSLNGHLAKSDPCLPRYSSKQPAQNAWFTGPSGGVDPCVYTQNSEGTSAQVIVGPVITFLHSGQMRCGASDLIISWKLCSNVDLRNFIRVAGWTDTPDAGAGPPKRWGKKVFLQLDEAVEAPLGTQPRHEMNC